MPRIASGRVFLGPSGFSCGSPSQESQGAAVAVDRKFVEARILRGTHTNPGWTFFFGYRAATRAIGAMAAFTVKDVAVQGSARVGAVWGSLSVAFVHQCFVVDCGGIATWGCCCGRR